MAKSTIVDLNGQPFNLSDLDAPQTEDDAKLAHLHRHYNDHPSGGLTPSKIATILKEAEQGNLIRQCELAEDMEEKDPHIQSELGKRKLAMQGPDWNIVPPPNASAAEWKDPSWFQTHPDRRNELRLRDSSPEGEPLRPFGWISHQAKAKSGYLARRGLVRVLAWPFLFKNYSVRDLAEFLEIYGLPLRLGKYPEGASDREKMTLLRAVMSIGHNAGGIIPKGMDIEFEKAADGASDPFMAMINWCEKSQSKAILGGTLTSQADGKTSTNALGNVHNEVREEIRNADLKALAGTLTRDLVYPMYRLNGKSFTSERRIPRFEFDLNEPEDLEAFTKPLERVVKLGVQVPISWVHEKTKIPQRFGDEPVLTLQPNTATPPKEKPVKDIPTQADLKSILLTALKAQDTEGDELDALASNLHTTAMDPASQLIDQIKQIVDNADSLESIRDQLLGADLSTDDFAEAMSDALQVAALAGRYELLQEAQ